MSRIEAARRWLNGLQVSTRATIVDALATLVVMAAHTQAWPTWTAIPVIIGCLAVGWVAAIADDGGLRRTLCRHGLHDWTGWETFQRGGCEWRFCQRIHRGVLCDGVESRWP